MDWLPTGLRTRCYSSWPEGIGTEWLWKAIRLVRQETEAGSRIQCQVVSKRGPKTVPRSGLVASKLSLVNKPRSRLGWNPKSNLGIQLSSPGPPTPTPPSCQAQTQLAHPAAKLRPSPASVIPLSWHSHAQATSLNCWVQVHLHHPAVKPRPS